MLAPKRLCRILDIEIKIAPLLVIFTFFIVLSNPGYLPVVLIMFGSLFAHEMGHAIAARRLNFTVHHISITLVSHAAIEGINRNPLAESIIALSGPLINLVIAATSGLFSMLSNSNDISNICQLITLINLIIGFGNLVPVFPLDGGRIIRGIFAYGTDYLNATRAVFTITKVLAIPFLYLLFSNDSLGFGEKALITLFVGFYCTISTWKEIIKLTLQTNQSGPITNFSFSSQNNQALLPFKKVIQLTWEKIKGGQRKEEIFNTPEEKETSSTSFNDDLEQFSGSLDEFFDKKE